MRLSRIFRLGVALVAGAICTDIATAWGGEGHRLIVVFASARLSASAKAAIDQLLALEPGATLATISTWTDEARAPMTAPWHYVNFSHDAGCHYEAATLCVGGSCVVSGIDRRVAVLASKAPDEERLEAPKYVVQLVGDAALFLRLRRSFIPHFRPAHLT
jgi:hypothetical protein